MLPLNPASPPRKPCLFIYPEKQSPHIYNLPDEDILKIFELAVNQANPTIEDLYTCSSLRKTSHRFRQISGDIISKINCHNVSLNKSDVKYLRHLRGIPLTLTNNFYGNIDLDNDIDDFIVFFNNNLVNYRNDSTDSHLLTSLNEIKTLFHTSFSHEVGTHTAFSVFREFISRNRINFFWWDTPDSIHALNKTNLYSFKKLIYELITIFTRSAPLHIASLYLEKCRELDEKNYELYKALFLFLFVRHFHLPPNINDILKIDDFKSAMGLAARGNYHLIAGNYEEALADLSEAITLNPEDAFALSLRGRIYCRKEELEKALTDLNKALQIIPYSSIALPTRGEVYGRKEEFDKALKDLNNALSITPNNADALRVRAEVYCAQGNFDAALKNITRSIIINANDASTFRVRAKVYRAQGNIDAALADLNQSLIINPNDANAFKERADIYRAKRNFDAALADLNQSLIINPNDADALEQRDRALRMLEKKNQDSAKESSVNSQEDQDELSLDLEDRSITSNSNKRSVQKSESSPKKRQPEDAEGN
jgi:tetratricopeptide (TPR) repeat protein